MPRPVLLVHGILGNRHIYWNLFIRRMRNDGFRVHDVVLPYAMLGDIRIAAGILRDKVDASLRGDHVKKVDLVCHSAGGLVVRYYLTYLGGNKHVDRVIFMGTPHQGTYFAYIMGLPVLRIARQTRPGSHLLNEIAGPGHAPPGVDLINFWSPVDGIVVPAENAILPGARNIKIPWITHWGFLWRKDFYERIRDALTDGDETIDAFLQPAP